ncbi:MAG: hypothetical protein GF329_10640 [Candidatus Lokiarchaeota archaeon]|nr:hypothetical protein [Candidatus Lokiarchaeota archaeon]
MIIMRICRYKEGEVCYGILKDGKVWDFLSDIHVEKRNYDIAEFIMIYDKNKEKILKLIDQKIDDLTFYEFKYKNLLAPIKRPSKIICLGLNYLDHAEETGMKLPKKPMLFSKAPSSIIGPNDPIRIPILKFKNKFKPIKFTDYEAELAIIMGKKAKMVEPDEVKDGEYIFGFTALNDVSARIEQQKDKQFYRSKSFDTFAPIGPWMITADQINDPMNLRIQSIVNDKILQDSNTNQMNFNIYEIITFISEGITLYPGDIIGTGTPSGVGVAKNPPVSLKAGDTVEINIENIGSLINEVILSE